MQNQDFNARLAAFREAQSAIAYSSREERQAAIAAQRNEYFSVRPIVTVKTPMGDRIIPGLDGSICQSEDGLTYHPNPDYAAGKAWAKKMWPQYKGFAAWADGYQPDDTSPEVSGSQFDVDGEPQATKEGRRSRKLSAR